MIGGGGSDIYYVDNVGDTVTETSPDRATGGIDSVYTTLPACTLPSNVEKLRILASGPANGTGNSLDNSLYAGPGNNVLDGGGGTDTLSYLYATGAVSVSLNVLGPQLTGASGTDTLISIENLYGGAFDDTLTGDANANRLDGGAGADTLSGGAGADTLVGAAGADAMSGGDGSDSYYVEDPGDLVAETNAVLVSGGNDTVYSYLVAYTLTSYVVNLQILAVNEFVYFASALRILEALQEIPKTMDVLSVAESTGFGYPFGGGTPYAGIKMLQACEIVTIHGIDLQSSRYFQWDSIALSKASEEDALEETFLKFQSAVRRRIRGDKTTFANPSGGLDSRCTVAALRAEGARVYTFNFSIPNTQD